LGTNFLFPEYLARIFSAKVKAIINHHNLDLKKDIYFSSLNLFKESFFVFFTKCYNYKKNIRYRSHILIVP
ncbi:MAG: hypothetical protein BV456_12595, partial [Thermoplasmata archaeon M8B2D]